MDAINLDKLTNQIDALISLYEKLKWENAQLRAKQNQLMLANESLMKKNHLTKTKLTAMLTKLRTLEQVHE